MTARVVIFLFWHAFSRHSCGRKLVTLKTNTALYCAQPLSSKWSFLK